MTLVILTFADLDTLAPRVLKFCVARLPTIPEPSTTGSATTRNARDIGAARRTYCAGSLGDRRQHACRCWHSNENFSFLSQKMRPLGIPRYDVRTRAFIYTVTYVCTG